tara:strand:+ start:625 stop:1044 length:420 start_codon:yes stop_codon:yes gene_type:complete
MEEKENLQIDLASDSKIRILDYGQTNNWGKGTYRVIFKNRAGFMDSSDLQAESPHAAFIRYRQPKAIHNISYVSSDADSKHTFPVYAKQGRKIWATQEFLAEVTVGDINQDMTNTNLYSQDQYRHVNAKTWSDKAFVQN